MDLDTFFPGSQVFPVLLLMFFPSSYKLCGALLVHSKGNAFSSLVSIPFFFVSQGNKIFAEQGILTAETLHGCFKF